MPSNAKRVGSLLHDPRYADLEVRCDGRTFLLHKAIVFAASEILAEECEKSLKVTGGKVVEHSRFDASTFECMLQFMYEGDYTVEAANHEERTSNGVNGHASTNSGKENMLPPHLRNGSDKALSVQLPGSLSKASPRTSKTAHALIYGIAAHYKLLELKTMALKRFRKAKETPTIADFPELTKTVYQATASSQDPLRKEFLALLLNDRSAWLATDHFAKFLSTGMESHEFAMDVIITMAQHLLEKPNHERSSSEAQATASKLLLSDLDQANEALAKSSSRIKALESELNAAKAENTKLEMEAQNQTEASRLLQSDLDQANEELARSKSGLRRHEAEQTKLAAEKSKLEAEKSKLQQELKEAKDYGEKCFKQVKADQTKVRELEAKKSRLEVDWKNFKDTNEKFKDKVSIAQSKLQEANTKLTAETARANRNGIQCDANLKACNQKDQTIKQKDAIIATEKARADKGLSIVRSIVRMVNQQCECRHCGESLSYTLQPDDRIGVIINTHNQPHNHMLRCFMCKTKEYGNLIYQG